RRNEIMQPEVIKLYKLIILYFLKRTGQETSNAILSDFILENRYTDYFTIQQTLHTLTEDQMISVRQTNQTAFYQITKKGVGILDDFGSQLPVDTRGQIEEYLRENHISIQQAVSVCTDYTKLRSREYLVTGTLKERGNVLLSVSLNVPTEQDAVQACEQFKVRQEEVYQSLLQILT
ncbi:MAG: DUF4364 family protein, partial [Lachnospiraceae bacterium]|nr:DUF4364 family protein [Lachnospiraceae bacterium]